jgi:ribonuclease T2
MIRRASIVAVFALVSPAAAHTQALQCRVPQRIEAPALPAPDGPRRALPIRGYTLALSWSPEFCRNHRDDAKSALQCGARMGRFGFILHGLWPESEPGHWPQWCDAKPVSAETLRRNLCMTPSLDLLTHEWAKHGSCMARSPEGYFKAGAALLGSLHFPDITRLSRRTDLTAGDLRSALRSATPFLPTSAIRVKANGSGWLEEVHICYGKDFMPAACAKRGAEDGDALKIWRGS